MGGKFKDLTGKTFERLTVIKRIGSNKHRESIWLCKCSCKLENEVIVTSSNLRSGNTKSCGCLNQESRIKNGKNFKKYNTYDLSGEYGIGYTFKNEPFYFNLEDYGKIKSYCWHKDDQGYIKSHLDNNNIIYMHRVIMNPPDDIDIDHIFGKTTRNDNRKENLRIATRSQNGMNSGLQSNNTSGVTGVCWSNEKEKWKVRIGVNYKTINLGYYDNFDEAVEVRKDAEIKYFKEYRYKL